MNKLIDIAGAEVGNREVGGNNRGPAVVKYQKATNLAPGAWSWCAAFVCWCLQKLMLQDSYNFLAPRQRPRTARAFGFEDWAKREGLPVLSPTKYTPKAGDLVIFEFSHIGIVTGVLDSQHITTIEGNTNGAGDRDSTSGDGVWRKERPVSLVKCYIKMP